MRTSEHFLKPVEAEGLLLATPNGLPTRFSFKSLPANMNVAILGSIGSGVNLTANALIVDALLQESDCIVIEFAGESVRLCDALSGSYYCNFDHNVSLNPFYGFEFSDFNQLDEMSALVTFTQYLAARSVELTQRQQSQIQEAVIRAVKRTQGMCGANDVFEDLKNINESLAVVLYDFSLKGRYSSLLNGPSDIVFSRGLNGIQIPTVGIASHLEDIAVAAVLVSGQLYISKARARVMVVLRDVETYEDEGDLSPIIQNLMNKAKKSGNSIVSLHNNSVVTSSISNLMIAYSSCLILKSSPEKLSGYALPESCYRAYRSVDDSVAGLNLFISGCYSGCFSHLFDPATELLLCSGEGGLSRLGEPLDSLEIEKVIKEKLES